jgi:hypothetical protein
MIQMLLLQRRLTDGRGRSRCRSKRTLHWGQVVDRNEWTEVTGFKWTHSFTRLDGRTNRRMDCPTIETQFGGRSKTGQVTGRQSFLSSDRLVYTNNMAASCGGVACDGHWWCRCRLMAANLRGWSLLSTTSADQPLVRFHQQPRQNKLI